MIPTLGLAAGEFDLRVGGRIELHFDNESLTDEPAPAGCRKTGSLARPSAAGGPRMPASSPTGSTA